MNEILQSAQYKSQAYSLPHLPILPHEKHGLPEFPDGYLCTMGKHRVVTLKDFHLLTRELSWEAKLRNVVSSTTSQGTARRWVPLRTSQSHERKNWHCSSLQNQETHRWNCLHISDLSLTDLSAVSRLQFLSFPLQVWSMLTSTFSTNTLHTHTLTYTFISFSEITPLTQQLSCLLNG